MKIKSSQPSFFKRTLRKEEKSQKCPTILRTVANVETIKEGGYFNDIGFKKPFIPNRQQPTTPKLINLSFSQPSTPKTPCFQIFPSATPSIRNTQKESIIQLTPLLKEPMQVFNEAKNHTTCRNSNHWYPDILQLIDDDTKKLEDVEQELDLFNEIPLCDNTIVDYLLHLSHDWSQDQPSKQSVKPEYKSPVDKKRKCRRAKPVSYEESLVYKEDKKRKDKERRQRRKELFETRSAGQRKGLRQCKPIKYF